MEDGRTCPDCQWTTYLITGRPIVFLRCDACKNWFHCNVKVRTSIGTAIILDASINVHATKDMVNSLLRCDCLAKQIFLVDISYCDTCVQQHYRVGMPRTNVSAPRLRLLPRHTLHHFIVRITREHYQRSSLPAYTLQRRCGAITEYIDRYLKKIATPVQRLRTSAYRQKRLEIRNAPRK